MAEPQLPRKPPVRPSADPCSQGRISPFGIPPLPFSELEQEDELCGTVHLQPDRIDSFKLPPDFLGLSFESKDPYPQHETTGHISRIRSGYGPTTPQQTDPLSGSSVFTRDSRAPTGIEVEAIPGAAQHSGRRTPARSVSSYGVTPEDNSFALARALS